MLTTTLRRKVSRAAALLCTLALGTTALPVIGLTGMLTLTTGVKAQDKGNDVLVFKDGRTVQGQITEETPTTVKIKVTVGTIATEVSYPRSDIVSISHGTAQATPASPATAGTITATPAAKPTGDSKTEPASDSARVYVLELTGTFGQDISQTPLRNAIRDAKNKNADYIIITMDNDWSVKQHGGLKHDLKDDDGAFDQFWRAEDMDPVVTEEIDREWTKKPTVVFWVKKAMGGAAFLPFNCPNIYFASSGKMGGVGHLRDTVKTGDEVVRQKLLGARLGHVEGMAIRGGYDPRIIRAMAKDEYVLSYKMEGGKATLLEREPQSPDEILIKNNARDEEKKDSEEALAREEGKNFLTLTADLARQLGVSKGTVDSLDDLLFQLNIARNHTIVSGNTPTQIMTSWRDGLDRAKREIPKLRNKLEEIQVTGNYEERKKARGQQIAAINQMQDIIKRYREVLDPGNNFYNELETRKQQIKMQQTADKPDKR